MNKKSLQSLAVITLLLTSLLSSALAYDCSEQDNSSTILVTGESKISVPADRVQVTLAVVTTAENPQEALDANKQKMNVLIDAIGNLGLDKKELKTSTYNLSPNWSPQPKNPPKDWKPSIISYTMTNSLEIKTTELELTGKIIQTALNSGANQIDRIYFDVSDEQKYSGEAIQKAVKNAMSDAKAAAESAGVKLGKIQTININNAYIAGNDYGRGVFAAKSLMYDNSVSAPAPNIAPGEVALSASVTLKIRIEQ